MLVTVISQNKRMVQFIYTVAYIEHNIILSNIH